MGRSSRFVSWGAAAPRWLAVGLFAAHVLACGIVVAAELPDTSNCWPTVVVRGSPHGEPLRARIYLYVVRPDTGGDEFVARRAGEPRTLEVGPVEIPGAFAGQYLVYVEGIAERRPLAKWKPPPGPRIPEVVVGADPYRRPEQIREFGEWRTWSIVYGNCLDSLVIIVKPLAWVTTYGERRISLRAPLPEGYRFER